LPPAARDRYRERYERRAEAWLKQAEETGDPSFLQRILEDAFLTRTAEQAIDRLAEEALRSGDFSTARQYWTMLVPLESSDRLLVRYPDPVTPLPDVLARLVVCRVLEGDLDRAEFELSVFAERFPEAAGTLAGRKGKWVELLDQLYKSAAAGGSESSRKTEQVVPPDVGASYWSLPLNGQAGPDAEPVAAERDVNGLTFYPRLWNNLILWNQRDWIIAYDFQRGLGAWLEKEPVSAQHWREQGRIFPPRADLFDFKPDRPVHGFAADDLTIHEGKLFARMAGPITAYTERENRKQPSRLICLDLQAGQGRLVWNVDAAGLDERLRFEGPPVVSDNRLWILARRGLAPSEVYLLCFSADNGKYLWNRLICSNAARAPEGANLASSLRIVRHESTLVVSTELGCIAALHDADGQPVWYRTYPRQMETNRAKTSPQLSPACIIHEGVVYAAPDDSDQLLALDLLTGETIWSQTRPDDHRVWGVTQDHVITSGKTLEARHVADGQLEWQFSAPVAELQGRGEGLITHDQIWWPTPTQILVFGARDGRVLKTIELRVSRQLQGGNLAATRKGLVISSPNRVTVLSPWGRGPVLKADD